MKWLGLVVISAFSVLSLAASAETIQISQKGRKFDPAYVDIKVGDTLHIVNDDEFIHHIYVTALGVDSDEQPPGNFIDIPFPRPGDYKVLCKLHPKMELDVHVK